MHILLFLVIAAGLAASAYRVRTNMRRSRLREAWQAQRAENDRIWQKAMDRRDQERSGGATAHSARERHQA